MAVFVEHGEIRQRIAVERCILDERILHHVGEDEAIAALKGRRKRILADGNPMYRLVTAEELPQTAQNLGVALPIVDATTAEELDIAFASAASQHADAMIVFGDPLTFRYATQITALAAKHRLPAMYLSRIFVTNGGLISYGPDLADLYFRAGGYVDKIFKGAKPSDLPVEQPTKFQLAINMKTAEALGLAVPSSLLFRADEVIE